MLYEFPMVNYRCVMLLERSVVLEIYIGKYRLFVCSVVIRAEFGRVKSVFDPHNNNCEETETIAW